MATTRKNVGDRVVCPDGVGVIVKVIDETAWIELDRVGHTGKKVQARFDMEDCKLEKVEKKTDGNDKK